MNNQEIIYIKDFIILKGLIYDKNLSNEYKKIEINLNTILIYKKSDVYSSFSLLKNIDNLTITIDNSFYPIFQYKYKNIEVLTPNYNHLFDLKLELSINYENIIEFIIFNTTLFNHTFHKEVSRLFRLKQIKVDKETIQLCKDNINYLEVNTFDIFNKIIEKLIEKTKSDAHGILLSGGNESRINAAIGNFYNLNRKFFTWGHPKNKEFIIASKIAKNSSVEHINIRINLSELPYMDFLLKTGFLSNMQYTYRYQIAKVIFEQFKIDHLWSGWGDVTGYIPINKSTEFFNYIFWNYTKERKIISPFWDNDFLLSYNISYLDIPSQKNRKNFLQFIFRFFYQEIAPYIYGQVIASESLLGNIVAPWFNDVLYNCIIQEELKQPKLYLHKKNRAIWKNNLYANIIKHYEPKLNYLKNSKNYYLFLFNDRIKYLGLPIAYFLMKTVKNKIQYFDPVEDRLFIKSKLQEIIDSDNNFVNKKNLKKMVKETNNWNGADILEFFKIIQIYFLFNY